MISEKKDPLTGESFIPKRHNQSFANRANQIAFNNNKARRKRLSKAFVDKKLDKNRTILLNLLKDQDEVVKSTEFLNGAGFDFKCFSMSTTIGGKNCQLVYEFAIYKNDNADSFTIKKIKPR